MNIKAKARIAKRSSEIIDEEKARQKKNSGADRNVVSLEPKVEHRPRLQVIQGGK